MEIQGLLNILIYILFGLVFINALRNDLEFHTFYSLLIAISFVLWFAFIRMHTLSLYAAVFLLILSYLLSRVERSEYNRFRQKLVEILDDIMRRSDFKALPPVVFPTPRDISRMFPDANARELYNGCNNAFAMMDENGMPFMVIMPAIVRNFSKDAVVFVILHELGHILLGHLHDALGGKERWVPYWVVFWGE